MRGKTRPNAGRTTTAAPEEPQLKRLRKALGRRYAVERVIGQGGMATVYLAEDSRHHRKVAVKVLRSDLTSALGPDRFLQEIGIAAQLQHPHILPLYDSGKAGGFLFYVMPFVDGESLRDKLYRERDLPAQETIRIIRDVVDALACAHERKVIHRDIKPDNVMLSGRHALVMDFGVAKAVSQAGDKRALTTHGITVGTPRYMAPEQAAGDPKIDHRADIYAVGVMAYELLAGRPPIDGETPQATLVAQVTEIPRPLREVAPDVPDAVSETIMRCLEKRPDDRWQSAADLLEQIDDIAVPNEEPEQTGTVHAAVRRIARSRVGAGAVGALILATAIVTVPLLRGDAVPPPVAALNSQLTSDGSVATVEISPNGEFLAYVSDSQVFVEDLEGGTRLQLASQQSTAATQVTTLRWSPDGAELLVIRRDADGRSTGLVYPRLGGPPRSLRARGYAAWSPDGDRVAWWLPHSPIYLLTVATGELDSVPLSTSDSAGYRFHGDWSPDGRFIALEVVVHDAPMRFRIWTVAVDGSGVQQVVDEARSVRSPRWSHENSAIYYLQDTEESSELRKVETRSDGGLRGDPRVLRKNMLATGQLSLTSDGGKLALARVQGWSDIWFATGNHHSTPVQFATRKLTTSTTPKTRARTSPDGMSVAYTQDGERGSEIIVLSLRDEHSLRRIDVGGRLKSAGAVWSPDGQQLAAVAAVQDTARVRIYDLDGASLTFGHRDVGTELRWAPGDRILYQRTGARNFNLLDSTQSEEQSLVSNDTVGWMSSPEVAPDGSRVAVHWNRGGRTAVWVVSLSDSSQTLLLTGSRYRPVGWSADGESVYVLNLETQAIFRIPASGGMAAEVGIVPFKSGDCTLQEHGDTLSLACAVSQGTSDAWVIENFDPELARAH